MSNAVHELDYAPAHTWRQSRIARRIFAGAIALLVIVLGVKFVPPAWDQARLTYWQKRAMSAPLPADRVVFDRAKTISPPRIAAWDNYYALFSPTGRKQCVTLFVQEMRRRDGQARLVAIDVFKDWTVSHVVLDFDIHVIEPGTLWRRPRLASNTTYTTSVHECLPFYGEGSTFYTGQPDPKDASHMTITYVEDGATKIIDGYLQNDDTFVLEARRK